MQPNKKNNTTIRRYADTNRKIPNPKQKRNAHKEIKGIKRVYLALIYSFCGLRAAWMDEEGFRQVVLIGLITGVLGLWLGENFSQKILLILPGFLCVVIELLNSAIENAVDFTSIKQHPFAKKAKDMGSAAQMLALGFLGIVWVIFICSHCL